jgi:hypothetical protein
MLFYQVHLLEVMSLGISLQVLFSLYALCFGLIWHLPSHHPGKSLHLSLWILCFSVPSVLLFLSSFTYFGEIHSPEAF